MLLSLDGTLVVQLVNFIVFLLILNVIFLRPVGEAIAKRRAYINGVAADIEQFESDLKVLRGQAQEQRAIARREADALIAEARAAAQGEAATIVAGEQARASALIVEAQDTVRAEIAAARANEPALVESLAREMLQRAVGSEIAV
jgi:F-type H+-transporting ATPase subunit b